MVRATAEYIIRGYQPADEGAVLDLLRLSLGESAILQRSSPLWLWKHISNPFGPSFVRVACDEDDQLIGMRAFMRWEFMIGDRLVKAVRAVDTATHPDYRRMGIFSALTKQVVGDAQGDGVDFIYNTPNQEVLPGYLKLGWRHVNKIQPLVKVLNYPVFAMGLLRSRLSRASHPHLSAEFFREEPLSVATFLERKQATETLIEQDAQLWDAQGRIRTRRSWEYIHWRYASHPTIPYFSVFLEHSGDLQGCIIFRTKTRYGLKEIVLCEMFLAEPNWELGIALLEQLRAGVRADYLISHFPQGIIHRQTLTRWGFRATPKTGINFAVRMLDTNLSKDPYLFDSWGLTMGDLELL